MTILLYTDASCKQGYSCYAYLSSLDTKPSVGLLRTSNIAAMEVLAIISGLKRLPDNSEVLVISDFKSAVSLILRGKSGQEHDYNPLSSQYYRGMCHRLQKECKRLDVDAVWVCSKFPSQRHLEVDQISKTVLQEYLKTQNR